MQNKSIKKKESNGLTLIELLVVIAILAILAGMSISALGEYIPDYRLQSAARELYTNMHKAKMEAIKRNNDVKIIFDVANSRYAISLDSGTDDDWQTINGNENLAIINLSKYSNVDYGIGNAQFKGINDVVSYNLDRASFGPTGTCGSGYIYLANSKGNSFAIGTLTSGVIVISKWQDNEWIE
jgi:type IV fimbrial biogenesis protein FimT